MVSCAQQARALNVRIGHALPSVPARPHPIARTQTGIAGLVEGRRRVDTRRRLRQRIPLHQSTDPRLARTRQRRSGAVSVIASEISRGPAVTGRDLRDGTHTRGWRAVTDRSGGTDRIHYGGAFCSPHMTHAHVISATARDPARSGEPRIEGSVRDPRGRCRSPRGRVGAARGG